MSEEIISASLLKDIIHIDGVTGNIDTWVKSAGVSILSDRIHFSGAGSIVDYIWAPYQNTPFPLSDPCVIEMDYRINLYRDPYEAVVLGHWGESGDWAWCHLENGQMRIADFPVYRSTRTAIPGMINTPSIRQKIKYVFDGAKRSFYLNDELKHEYTGGVSSYPSNWVIGTYWNATNPGSYWQVSRLDLDLFKLSIRFQ